jgi:hypothetical protein
LRTQAPNRFVSQILAILLLARFLYNGSIGRKGEEIGMNFTDEDRTLTICQTTEHAMLIPWGRFSRYLQVRERIQDAVPARCHKDATPGGDLILEFGLASLCGCEYLEDLNLGAHPLVKDQAVQDAWGFQFRHYTTVSRFLYELGDSDIEAIETALEGTMRPYIRGTVHEVLCHQDVLTLCGDLTGRPVSAYSETYPPDTVFGYMANLLRKGHQAALVTLKGLHHRIHVAAFHHRGDTVSGPCLREMVMETEARLGCRPHRRTELVPLCLAALDAKITQRQEWCQAQRAVIRQQVERQILLGNQLQALREQLAALEREYEGKTVRPHSRLARARQQQTIWERQLQSALDQEGSARRVLDQHQQYLDTLLVERNEILNWLAQLEVDNATHPNPVRIRWLLDGGFGDASNVMYLIEMGYDVYVIAHGGSTTQSLLKEVPTDATWSQAGVRTQALDVNRQQLGQCPYPVRLTLLRWQAKDELHHSTLISFSDAEEQLPTAELFPTYHQRQDVEAGIKQGKGTFSFTKLRVRSAAGIRLLGQLALFFWPNFVHWASSWLAGQVQDEHACFGQVLQEVRTQVRTAANTTAIVLTNASRQLLEFAHNGPYPGVQVRLDGPFVYQFPMPLFQAWECLWPVSSESVKEQVAALMADKGPSALTEALFAQLGVRSPEKVAKIGLDQ